MTNAEKVVIMEDIVSMGKIMGSEIGNQNIEELMEDHCTELAPEKLVHLKCRYQKTVTEEICGKEKVVKENVPRVMIKLMCVQ